MASFLLHVEHKNSEGFGSEPSHENMEGKHVVNEAQVQPADAA
jgi:hypothetical protein